jgi:hypothetical protein
MPPRQASAIAIMCLNPAFMERPEQPGLDRSRGSRPARSNKPSSQPSRKFDRKVLGSLVLRIEVQKNRLVVSLKPTDRSAEPQFLSVLWQKPPSRRSREILLPHGTLRENIRPERAERRARLVNASHDVAAGSTNSAQAQSPTRNNWPNASDARCAESI